MKTSTKTVKSLISGLLVNDDQKVDRLIKEMVEARMPTVEGELLNVLVESMRGDRDV
jgi:hypothetical protein